MAGIAGLEPTKQESKSCVLPLHHIPILERAKGFEPSRPVWKTGMLTIKHHTRVNY